MISPVLFRFPAAVTFTLLILAQPVSSRESPKPWRGDNSGRQIAVVGPVSSAHADGSAGKVPARSGQTQPRGRLKDDIQQTENSPERSGTLVPSTPPLSPEVKQAVEQGAMAAESMSRIASKRVSDVGIWVSTVWREFNSLPRPTPNSSAITPEPPHGIMRPLMEPDKHPSQLWYTNERRMKTVVGR